MTSTLDAPAEARTSRAKWVVDVDVHETGSTSEALQKYIDPAWEPQLKSFWKALRPSAYLYTPGVSGGSRGSWILPDGRQPGSDPDAMRRHVFEEEGVSIALLNGLFFPGTARTNLEFASALVSAYNDWHIDEWMSKDPRFRGTVHVASGDPIAAAEEIDRIGSHPQIVQVFLPSATDVQYGDKAFWPIYEAAVRNKLTIMLHHTPETQSVNGYPHYLVEWHTALPMAAIGQVISMVSHGVFEKFPELKLVVLETGVAWVPWLMWRFDDQVKAYRSEVPWLKRLPSEYMRDHVRVSTQALSDVTPGQFVQLIESVGSEQMYLFSSDYPHYDADTADVALPHTLPEEIYRRVRWQNAVETYPKLDLQGTYPGAENDIR
jgi:predicted TIM-barrel fold metal-dependent hydrolase